MEGGGTGASKRQSPFAVCARKSSLLFSWGKGWRSLRYPSLGSSLQEQCSLLVGDRRHGLGIGVEEGARVLISPH